jgi:hypothetical protein
VPLGDDPERALRNPERRVADEVQIGTSVVVDRHPDA